ncbi:pre-mRNA processing factor 3-domain-containing protein [Kickxella alabastrina]|uniref:pre-mRNA processing factor 3-domain-containing protein n=1 Tax=Kickxella alabastrina TaxID=61397 RepID=UPI0022207756|nr:pre-mRNA processing factor 3-domain-containing protein [Kickxella alabastrina]KAI7824913.1 pre-mRNA processing factor 3-domain-containing protein [Kickxella alabastrina]
MAPPTQEEINALIAKKRAEVMSRIAGMNIPSGGGGGAAVVGVRPSHPRPSMPTPRLGILAARPPSTGTLNTVSIQDTIAATRARVEAQLNAQRVGTGAVARTGAGASSTGNAPTPRPAIARPAGAAGQGQSTELHPMLLGNIAKPGNMRPTMPRISSIKANQRKDEAPKIKRLKIEREVPASFTDPLQNPYLDAHLGSHLKIEPQQRRAGRQFSFVQPGRFIAQAERLRAEARVDQLKAEIAARAEKAQLETEFLDATAIRPQTPPPIEWWDAPFLGGNTYAAERKLTGADSPVTIYVQHPVMIDPPAGITNGEAAPSKLILTQKERKKIRRQRRMEQQREHRDKVMLGLLPPDPPKLRMSNFMRIMANQSVPDPTRLEAEVRKQMRSRIEKHEAENQASMLTKEQRAEKARAKLQAEEAKGVVAAVFRVSNLAHPQHRYKVQVNAKEMHLTGVALACPRMGLVVVEGPEKLVRAYKKLMLRRIDWTDMQPRLDSAPAHATPAHAAPAPDAGGADNACHLIWQGEVERRRFRSFRLRVCPAESQARNWLAGAGCESYWQLAKQYDASDSITALDPLV